MTHDLPDVGAAVRMRPGMLGMNMFLILEDVFCSYPVVRAAGREVQFYVHPSNLTHESEAMTKNLSPRLIDMPDTKQITSRTIRTGANSGQNVEIKSRMRTRSLLLKFEQVSNTLKA